MKKPDSIDAGQHLATIEGALRDLFEMFCERALKQAGPEPIAALLEAYRCGEVRIIFVTSVETDHTLRHELHAGRHGEETALLSTVISHRGTSVWH